MMAVSLDGHLQLTHPDSPVLAYWRARLGRCALGGGDAGRARKLASQAPAAFTAQPGVASFYKAPLRDLGAALGLK